MDKLQLRAQAFEKLIENEYKFKLGRKGIITEINLDFEPADFFI